MKARIGFTGWIDDKFKVFFNGDLFYANVDGMALAIDWDKIDNSRKKLR